MKKLLSLVLLFVMAIGLSGCGMYLNEPLTDENLEDGTCLNDEFKAELDVNICFELEDIYEVDYVTFTSGHGHNYVKYITGNEVHSKSITYNYIEDSDLKIIKIYVQNGIDQAKYIEIYYPYDELN